MTESQKIKKIFDRYKIETVINLAAQAGVRYSIENPNAYIKSNLEGFFNILEYSKNYKVKKFFYASSSSVYGSNKKLPFSEEDTVKNPISLYAATKLSNEILSESYSKMFKMNIVGLRFFTVYGPWGRPDMALFKFTEKILNNKKLEVYNYGKMLRDFTYVDDITESIFRLFKIKKFFNHEIFNIGNNSPVKLMDFILMIEKVIGVKGKYKFLPLQNGDVRSTYSDTKKLFRTIKFKPSTKLMDGIKRFVEWYLKNYQR